LSFNLRINISYIYITMIYLIPKNFNSKKQFIEDCFKYLDSLTRLDIIYNSKKSMYPRLRESKKRGKCALVEILTQINPSCFSDTFSLSNELTNCLNWGLKKTTFEGIEVLTVNKVNKNLFLKEYFPLSEWNHISMTERDLLNNRISVMNSCLLERETPEVIDAVLIIKKHIDNYILGNEDKLDIIKYLSNLN